MEGCLQRLSETEEGSCHIVKWMFGPSDALDALRMAGIREGVQVHVICNDLGSLVVRVSGRKVALSADAAGAVKV